MCGGQLWSYLHFYLKNTLGMDSLGAAPIVLISKPGCIHECVEQQTDKINCFENKCLVYMILFHINKITCLQLYFNQDMLYEKLKLNQSYFDIKEYKCKTYYRTDLLISPFLKLLDIAF